MIERKKRMDSLISADDTFQVKPARTLFASGKLVWPVIISSEPLSGSRDSVVFILDYFQYDTITPSVWIRFASKLGSDLDQVSTTATAGGTDIDPRVISDFEVWRDY